MIRLDKLNPFGRMCITLGMMPSSYKESLTYEEQLLWFMRFLEEVVIPAYNKNVDAINELQSLYEELKSYVDNYFENLDVQEEINNKLDDMAESGELEEIIATYLSIASVLNFDTVADMKTAENLIDGSVVKTLGYYSVNDGGSGLYKVKTITNEDPSPDDASVIALSDPSLIAILITSEVNLPTFGLYGDGTHDDTEKFTNAINYAKENNLKVTSPKDKVYLISDTLDVSNLYMDLNDATIKSSAAIEMLEIDESDSYKNGHFQNIIIDANNIATKCINIITSRRSKFNNLNFINVKNIGIDIQAGYELMFDLINMQSVELSNTTNIGFKVQTRDCNFTNITTANICAPFYLKAIYGNYFNKIHSWIGQSPLIKYSTMFLINITYPEALMMSDIYCDTMRYFVKYESGSSYVSSGHITGLIVEYNRNIYTRDLEDSILFYCNNDDETKYINIVESSINGLVFANHLDTDAKTLITNRSDFLGNIENTFYSAISYTDIKELINVNENFTLGINNIYKSDKTIYVNIIGSYDSSTTNGNITLGNIPSGLGPNGALTTYCMVTDDRWDYVTPTPYYMYIGTDASGGSLQLRLPSGTGTKWIFITLCYNKK